jgi:hypothetical protein
MKRFILLGVAVLFATSMAMAAAELDIDAAVSMNGDYTGTNIHVGVAAEGTLTLDGDLTADAVLIADSTVMAAGTVNVVAGTTLNVATFNVSGGWLGTLNVEGTMNCSGLFNYDGNGAQYNTDSGVYGAINVSGSGAINAGAHFIFGGYDVAYAVDANFSGNAVVSGGMNRTYVGGVAGGGNVVMSGSAVFHNDTKTAGLYDNTMYVGWAPGAGAGTLTVESGNTVEFRHININPTGTVNYILDAAGAACVLTAKLPSAVDPETENTDCYVTMEIGSTLNLDTTGVAAGLLVEGFEVDIATAPTDIRWQGSYGPTLLVDGVANSQWALREKTPNTLQAYIVPEPTTMALIGLGGLLIAMRRRS